MNGVDYIEFFDGGYIFVVKKKKGVKKNINDILIFKKGEVSYVVKLRKWIYSL